MLIVVISLSSFGQGIDIVNLKVTHRPYLQNIDATGVSIIWTTNKPSIPGVNLTTSDGKIHFIRSIHDGIIDCGGLLNKVRINGLEPGNTYKYSIFSVQILKYQAYKIYYGDTLAIKPVSFIIPPEKSEKIGYTLINDVHENSGKLASYLKNGNVTAQDFYFFIGDMVDDTQSTVQFVSGFIDTAVAYSATRKPFYYVKGNHESRGYDSRYFKDFFDFKDARLYYCFDFGPVHFVVLDCGEDKPDNNKCYYGLTDNCPGNLIKIV